MSTDSFPVNLFPNAFKICMRILYLSWPNRGCSSLKPFGVLLYAIPNLLSWNASSALTADDGFIIVDLFSSKLVCSSACCNSWALSSSFSLDKAALATMFGPSLGSIAISLTRGEVELEVISFIYLLKELFLFIVFHDHGAYQ
eukprot:NODE_945_length_2856_cov_0.287631.p4 type:complete len:143 gc:universal NODE_945_length_2856_cov_0.287631:440-12(-)